MLTGIILQANPNEQQKKILSQWMGCARFIWNAKCSENHYLYQFAKRYLPLGTYPEIDQFFSQFKSKELSPWLFGCPSQILRNSAHCWYQTYKNFLKGLCLKPKKKKKSDGGSIHLTRELFRFEKCKDGVVRLFIGTKTNHIGYLSIKMHKKFKEPKSITIKKNHGKYTVSFCYEDGLDSKLLPSLQEHLTHLKELPRSDLEEMTVGTDRGVKRPIQSGKQVFDFSLEQKLKKQKKEQYIRRCQRRLSKQKKGSKRRKKRKEKLSKAYEKIANIRKDFCHQSSRAIVENEKIKVIVLEDLKSSQMTKRPKPKKDEPTGKWLKNKRKAKAGLNRSILDKNWHQFEVFLSYKAYRKGKALFKVRAHYTSQECADCGHTHPDNRITQDKFVCIGCGHSDHADQNAAEVIKKRAINLILYSGTELSSRGVLLDTGRGVADKTREAKANRASNREASKKKELTAHAA